MSPQHILQDFYTIVPAPYVVEIDQHPRGPELQAALETLTGRRTVPNVFINGKSIGGGDDVEALHMKSKLMEKIRDMGGKRLTSIATKMAAMVPNPGKQK
jgi:glutaredoxin